METLVNDLLTPIVLERAPKQRKMGKPPWFMGLFRVYFQVVGRIIPRIVARQAIALFGKPQRRYKRLPSKSIMDKSKKFQVVSDSLQITGHLWDNSGPTVLLVHGWETGGLHLSGFVEPLWSLGFRIVAMDGPAHGESEGIRTNLPHFARAIVQVMDKIGPVHHIIAHSFGGAASSYMAATTGIKLNKLVLISVPNKLVRIVGDFAQYLRIPAIVERKMHQVILEVFQIDPYEMDISKLGDQMNVDEILVVHDKGDQIVPFYNALEITHGLDQACILPCENLGHNSILKNPQVTTRVAQFLKDDLKR